MQSLWKARSYWQPHLRRVAPSEFLGKLSYATKAHEPLRILFCGSDAFSVASLEALHKFYAATQPTVIESLDVVCRPAKRVGRGLKALREVPIKKAAQHFGLQVHEIDTFTGWQPPKPNGVPINLVIAVSFGLLVPPRILNNAKYGGLNVHPSLLPDLRGPAPLHHTLLQKRKNTGVTVQTLHPKDFDQGAIIAQTPSPGIPIPDPETCTPNQLLEVLAPIGGKMLVEALEAGLFVPPIKEIQPFTGLALSSELRHAHKVTPNDMYIDWQAWSAEDIILRQRIFQKLWDDELHRHCSPSQLSKECKRVTYHEWRLPNSFAQVQKLRASPTHADRNLAQLEEPRIGLDNIADLSPGTPCWVYESTTKQSLGVVTCDKRVICPTSATIDSRPKGEGVPELTRILTQNQRTLYSG